MADELDQRVRSLEAERCRPMPGALPLRTEPLDALIERRRILDELVTDDDGEAHT